MLIWQLLLISLTLLGDAGVESEQGWEDFPGNRFHRGTSEAQSWVPGRVRQPCKAAGEPWGVKSDAIWVTALGCTISTSPMRSQPELGSSRPGRWTDQRHLREKHLR